MEKYYHITSYENLESIYKNGLIPKSGNRTQSIGDKRCAVFFSKGISNAILMYSSLLHHYNSYTGENGLKIIQYYKDIVKEYLEKEKNMPLDQEDSNEMEAILNAIDWIKELMKFGSFDEYIGDGVYLTISGITNVNLDNEVDCYTSEIVSPESIKVILLKNKETGKIVDFRESVLSYFLSMIPKEDIINKIHNAVTIENIKELYDMKKEDISYYNCDNFELVEVPISFYFENGIQNKENSQKR